MDMEFKRKLAIPMEVKEMYPLTEPICRIVDRQIEDIRKILDGRDSRKLMIIGPCSADREDSVLDYLFRLRGLQEKVREKILIVPRLYTNKPRTTGEGYKGMVHQPDPMGEPDLFKGIIATRKLHMRAIQETGFACADEMLYPENFKYLDDLLAYIVVGARSVENQQHRLTASGVGIPAGMKNPTSGVYSVMLNAVRTAQNPHSFIYRGWEAVSHGNPYAHAILRGYTNKHGQNLPNYHYEDLSFFCEMYDQMDLQNPAVIIDASHSNSGKDPFAQPRIIREVLNSCKNSGTIARHVKGFMAESYIEDGSQPIGGGCYGMSITDPCLGWEKTVEMMEELSELL